MMARSLFLLPQTLHMLWIRLRGDVSTSVSTYRYLTLKLRSTCSRSIWATPPHSLTQSDFECIARRTDGFSGSDIAVWDVLFEPMRKTQDAMFFVRADNGAWMPCGPKRSGAVQITMQELAAKGLAAQITPQPISMMDFEKVLARQRPTVSKRELDVHTRFTREFGEEG